MIETGTQTPELLKSMGRQAKEIEELYNLLEDLHDQYEKDKKSFE